MVVGMVTFDKETNHILAFHLDSNVFVNVPIANELNKLLNKVSLYI